MFNSRITYKRKKACKRRWTEQYLVKDEAVDSVVYAINTYLYDIGISDEVTYDYPENDTSVAVVTIKTRSTVKVQKLIEDEIKRLICNHECSTI